MVRVRCSHCPQTYQVPEERLGRQATCKKCQHTFTLEAAADDAGVPQSKPLSTSAASSVSTAIPWKLGPYFLKRKLGAGAMGEVWLAHDMALERDAALKLMAPGIASDPKRRQRFEREAKTAARLLHPNTVAVYSFGVEGEHAYLAMELVDGSSLDKIVSAAADPLPWREATRVICDAATGLAAAHEIGLVHRDIKPANLMRTTKGVTKVVDFGLARAAVGNTQLTHDGTLLGTPAFMAPEQWANGEVDARSDLYSLICTYYFLLTGRLPFDATSLPSLGYQHRYQPFPDPRQWRADLPDSVCRILVRGAQKNPADRYHSAVELVAELESLLDSPEQSLLTNRPWQDLVASRAMTGDVTSADPESRKTSVSGADFQRPLLVNSRGIDEQMGRRGHPMRWVVAATGGLAMLSAIIFYVVMNYGTNSALTIGLVPRAAVAGSTPDGPGEPPISPAIDPVPPPKQIQPDPTIPIEFQRLKERNLPGTYALQFDGQRSRVRILRSNFKFFGDTSLTIEAVVVPREPSSSLQAIISDLAGSSGFQLAFRSQWSFGYLSDSPDIIGVTHVGTVVAGQRVHLAAVYDKQGRELRLFVDGRLNDAVLKITQPYRESSWDTIIGADPNHPQPKTFVKFFAGSIEQVSISRIARYAKDFEPERVLRGDQNTVVLYHFNEGEGNTAYDSSGKGNHANIQGAQWVKVKELNAPSRTREVKSVTDPGVTSKP